MAAPLQLAGVAVIGAAALQLRDPHSHTIVVCPFRWATGWDCPLCGGLRAVHDLGQGDLAGAWSSNALFIGLLPLLAVAWLLWLRRSWRGEPSGLLNNKVWVGIGVLALAFMVFRNTPWGAAWAA